MFNRGQIARNVLDLLYSLLHFQSKLFAWLRLVQFILHLTIIYAGRNYGFGRGMHRFSTAAVLEEPITPPVQINYTKLLINGLFVDSASGNPDLAYSPFLFFFLSNQMSCFPFE